ncbi:MAG: hypothetical protein ABIA04_03275 [Pseudomonadota bacterium]
MLDIGGYLNFSDKDGNFNTMSGPMQSKQIRQYFKGRDDNKYFKVGLYIEIDYWKNPNKEFAKKKILSMIDDLANSNWDKSQAIKDVILKDS